MTQSSWWLSRNKRPSFQGVVLAAGVHQLQCSTSSPALLPRANTSFELVCVVWGSLPASQLLSWCPLRAR